MNFGSYVDLFKANAHALLDDLTKVARKFSKKAKKIELDDRRITFNQVLANAQYLISPNYYANFDEGTEIPRITGGIDSFTTARVRPGNSLWVSNTTDGVSKELVKRAFEALIRGDDIRRERNKGVTIGGELKSSVKHLPQERLPSEEEVFEIGKSVAKSLREMGFKHFRVGAGVFYDGKITATISDNEEIELEAIFGSVFYTVSADVLVKKNGRWFGLSSWKYGLGWDRRNVDEEVIKNLEEKYVALKSARSISKVIKLPFYGRILLKGKVAGIWLHEVIGHGSEGDEYEGISTSVIKRKNQKVAPKWFNLVDDPLCRDFGLITADDEAVPAKRVEIIKNGKLVGFLHSLHTAGTKSNGHGRGEIPIPRQTNLIAYSSDPWNEEELQEEAELIIPSSLEGYVNPSSWRGEVEGILLVYARSKGEFKPFYAPRREIFSILVSFDDLRNIIGIGKEKEAYRGFCGKQFMYERVSAISPDILVETELQTNRSFKDPFLTF